MKNDKKKIIKEIGLIVIAVILVLPSLVMTLYSYPCQDDFHYAFYGREMMEQGYNLLTMSWAKTVEYYKTFCGCYTSSFLGYFFSGIINCNIWGIRIFELISALIFYFALYVFVRTFAYKVMGFAKEKVLPLYCLLLACFNCLIYYSDHDDFYWFITSVQYLFISSLILLGTSAFMYVFYEEEQRKKVILLICASVCGFLGSGGTLSIAAFCCVLYFFAAAWGVFIRKQPKFACIGMGVTLLGAIINGIAPGNYMRDGQAITIGRLLHAIIQSFRYTLERWETFVKNPVFWIILILLVILLFTCESNVTNYNFKFPIVFVGVLFCMIAGIIFPTILGYGYKCYVILNRGNFISDMAFYLFIFMALFYAKGWVEKKYPALVKISINRDVIMGISILIVALLILDRFDAWQIPIVRGYRDWAEGNYREYADFCVGIYEEIAESPEDVVEIHREFVNDGTCMMNPQFYVGRYDPEVEYANTTIARFYGKTAVHIYLENAPE